MLYILKKERQEGRVTARELAWLLRRLFLSVKKISRVPTAVEAVQ